MVLSPRVARSGEKGTAAAKPARKAPHSPFGGMNRTSVRMVRPPNPPSRAALQRTNRLNQIRDADKKGTKEGKNEGEPFHALKMQRALNNVSYGSRERVKKRIADTGSFDDFGLLPTVRQAVYERILPHMEERVPSPVQRVAIPALLGQGGSGRRRSKGHSRENIKEFLIAAETGSGKTMAYALPILDAIKRAEALEEEDKMFEREAVEQRLKQDPHYVEPPPLHDAPHTTSGRPRAIILVPSAELVSQVWSVFRALSFTVKVRSDGISAAVAPNVIRRRVFAPSGIDVLVSTPHLLDAIASSDPYVLGRVRHLVVDEADSLLDRSFASTTVSVIDRCRPSLEQLIFCSATIPRSLDSALRERFPKLQRLVTPNLHAVPRRVVLGVVDIEKQPYMGNRNLACADTINSIGKSGADVSPGEQPDPSDLKHVLVFVNEREKTTEVSDYLQTKGIDAMALNRDTPEQRKAEILTEFTTTRLRENRAASSEPSSSKPTPAPSAASAKVEELGVWRPRKAGQSVRPALAKTKVLVTTDLASRGIDTLAVRNVILYDVPHTTIDFIHRLGRTGRMKMRGRGVVLVGKRDRRDVVREVREGMFRGQALL